MSPVKHYALNSSSQSSLFFIIINHKISAHVGVCLITIRMMQVIKLASSMEFTTKIWKVSNFCTKVIHFKLEALLAHSKCILFLCMATLLLPVVLDGWHEHWQVNLFSFQDSVK